MISDNLRKVRKDHKLTQQDLANVLGIDRTTYTFYETGKTNPSIETLKKIGDIFNVTIGYLCGYEENRPELRRQSDDIISSPDRDPLAELSKEEKYLLMYFRIMEPEKKQQAIEYFKDLTKE